jgi:hypothetical protein
VSPFIAGDYDNLLKVERDHIESIYVNIRKLSDGILKNNRCLMSDDEAAHFSRLNYQQQVNVVLAFFGNMAYVALFLDIDSEDKYTRLCKKTNNYQWSFPEIFNIGIVSRGYFNPIDMLPNSAYRIE